MTGLAAVATSWMAWKTRDLAEETKEGVAAARASAAATQRAAEATRDDADATLAVASQGRYALQPMVVVESNVHIPSLVRGSGARSYVVRNIGLGPAIGCVFAAHNEEWWEQTARFHLAPGADTQQPAYQPGDAGKSITYEWFLDVDAKPGDTGYGAVIFCRDVFGRRYRFPIDDEGHVLGPEIMDPPFEGPPWMWWMDDDELWPKSDPVNG
jgi:hypothetical protein